MGPWPVLLHQISHVISTLNFGKKITNYRRWKIYYLWIWHLFWCLWTSFRHKQNWYKTYTIIAVNKNTQQEQTRTTRTPAFWGYPPLPHDYPYHWVILDPKSKEDKVKVTNLKLNFCILKWALHATHLLKLLDKMCKYEMDPMSIVEDTERTRFCPQTDRRTDGQTDRRTRWCQYNNHIFCNILID